MSPWASMEPDRLLTFSFSVIWLFPKAVIFPSSFVRVFPFRTRSTPEERVPLVLSRELVLTCRVPLTGSSLPVGESILSFFVVSIERVPYEAMVALSLVIPAAWTASSFPAPRVPVFTRFPSDWILSFLQTPGCPGVPGKILPGPLPGCMDGAAMVQVSVRIQYEVIGIHMAIHAEAKALFRTHEENTACIHAANSGYVQRHFRFLSFRSDWHGFPCFSLYGIGAGSDMEGIGPDGRIDPGRPGIDSQESAFLPSSPFPSMRMVPFPFTLRSSRFSPASNSGFPVARMARPVLMNPPPLTVMPLGLAMTTSALFPATSRKPFMAVALLPVTWFTMILAGPLAMFDFLYVTCQFRFGKGIGIIQDGPFFRDIEPVIVISGYTGSRGSCDMNQGNPIGCLLHQGMAGSGSPGIGHNGCCGENS